jgi:hypothetical protein
MDPFALAEPMRLLLWTTDENQVPQSTLARSRLCISEAESTLGGFACAPRPVFANASSRGRVVARVAVG